MLLGGHTRFGRKEPFTRAIEMVVHIGATSQIRLNDPCKAAMRPYVELLRPPVTPSPIGERSIVMSLSVCVCLFAIISLELHVPSSPNFCAYYPWPWLGPPLAA